MASFPGQKSTGAPLPNQVQGFSAVLVSVGQVNLSWTAVALALSYTISRNGALLASGVSAVSYSDVGVSPNTVYSYSVQAVNANGAGLPSSLVITTTNPTIFFQEDFTAYPTGNVALTSAWTSNGYVDFENSGIPANLQVLPRASLPAGLIADPNFPATKPRALFVNLSASEVIERLVWGNYPANTRTISHSMWQYRAVSQIGGEKFVRDGNFVGGVINANRLVDAIWTLGNLTGLTLIANSPNMFPYGDHGYGAVTGAWPPGLIHLETVSTLSTGTNADGSASFYINGVLVAQATGLRYFNNASDAAIGWQLSEIGEWSSTGSGTEGPVTYPIPIYICAVRLANSLQGVWPMPAPPAQVTGLTATALSSSSIGTTWTATPGATSYTVDRNGSPVGSPATNSFTDTGLAPSTSYTYTVAANGAGGQGAFSAPASATTQPSGGTVKFTPGHYGSSPTLIHGSADITSISSIYNAIVPYTNIHGLAAVFSHGALEPIKGELDTSPTYPGGWATCRTKVRQFINIMAAMSPPRKALIKIQLGSYTQTNPSINDFGIIPQYIQTDSTYGPTAGFRISGTTTTVAGRYGWWGGNGNGNTYSAPLHRSVYTNRLKLLLAAIAAEADTDPNYEGTYFDEDSFLIGAWSANGPPDYSQGNFNTNVQSMLSLAVAQFPHTSVMWQVSFSGTATNSQDFCAFMTANRVDWSNTDVLGKTYADAHSGMPYTWGAQAMCGFLPSGGTRTPVNYSAQGYGLFPEVQGNDLGAFGHAGLPQASTKEDILAMMNQVMRCKKAFWNIMLPPASNWGGTLLPNSTWDFMGPYLNDPANALLNTSKPVNYP